jgi:hypothetical protein
MFFSFSVFLNSFFLFCEHQLFVLRYMYWSGISHQFLFEIFFLYGFLILMWFYYNLLNTLICFLHFAFWFQEKKRNSLKDFLNVAGPMGVTHFLMLSKTETAPYLRVARTPQGPTLTFKIHEYSLAVDVAQSQLHPRCPQDLFKNAPLVKFCILSKHMQACIHFTFGTDCSFSSLPGIYLDITSIWHDRWQVCLFEIMPYELGSRVQNTIFCWQMDTTWLQMKMEGHLLDFSSRHHMLFHSPFQLLVLNFNHTRL